MLMGFLIMFMVDFKISSIFFPFFKEKTYAVGLGIKKIYVIVDEGFSSHD